MFVSFSCVCVHYAPDLVKFFFFVQVISIFFVKFHKWGGFVGQVWGSPLRINGC
ncbi:hypothetical protein GIB67_034472 [Kingdonia uniflora]|uniref:Uncharacterized protein n=1 Tax=Kingdonia uniflora TaxID=39325 RepID=A0A7J7PBA0_9MAGN|nr:hypothetical protein GIB67_034472 [Kingdonia uniflora]